MRVLLDTDVLLDVALDRGEFAVSSGAVLNWAQAHPGQAVIAWHSLANIAYLLRPDARPFLRDLLVFADVAPSSVAIARQALLLPLTDFEDALQAAAAMAAGAACVITRNASDFRRSPVPAVSPAAFLSEHG